MGSPLEQACQAQDWQRAIALRWPVDAKWNTVSAIITPTALAALVDAPFAIFKRFYTERTTTDFGRLRQVFTAAVRADNGAIVDLILADVTAWFEDMPLYILDLITAPEHQETAWTLLQQIQCNDPQYAKSILRTYLETARGTRLTTTPEAQAETRRLLQAYQIVNAHFNLNAATYGWFDTYLK